MKNIAEKVKYYMSLPYTIEIVPYQDGGFFAKVKELPGCMTEGDTLEETLELLEEAKRLWFETMLEDGMEIPLPESKKDEKEYNGRILLRLPKYLHKRLVEEAQREGVSVNSYIVSLLAERNRERELLRELLKGLWLKNNYEDEQLPYGEYETKLKRLILTKSA